MTARNGDQVYTPRAGKRARPTVGNEVAPSALNGRETEGMRLLLIEDNDDDVFLTRRAFRKAAPDFTIDAVIRGDEGVARAEQGSYDLAVVDYQLPDMSGMDVLYRLVSLDLPVIIVTGRGDEKVAVQALKSGAVDYLVKDEGYLARLPLAASGAVARSRLIRENQRLIAETARQASLLEAVLRTDPGAVAVLRGPELRVELLNPSFRNLAPDFDDWAPMGRPLDEVLPEDLAPDIRQAIHEVYRAGEAFSMQNKLVELEGKQRYFHVHLMPLNTASTGSERGVAVILWETTEEVVARKRIEELARETEGQRRWLQAVIDQMPSGVYIVAAPDGRILFTNRAANLLVGSPPVERITAADVPKMYHARNPDGSEIESEETGLARALHGETVIGRHVILAREDGKQVDVLSNSAPLSGAGGEIVAAISVFQDISDLKELDRLKDEFMSIASHELRTPLTNMRAAAQLVLRRVKSGEYPKQEIALINTIMQQSDRMTRLVEELLDVSRLQSGRFQIHAERFDLAQLVREVMSNSKMSSPDFSFQMKAEGQSWVVADRDRIAQVVANLLDNAVKYSSKQGTVRVKVRKLLKREVVQVEVEDTGMGFEPREAEKVFERFSRLGSVTHHSRGMGLGLFICRQIMAAHGGTITAESAGPGQGATFTFTLPLDREDAS